MSTVIEQLEREQLRRLPEFQPGDRVRVHFQVIEGNRRRTQVFEGVVIARSGHGIRETITVRKQSFGVGVERVFPLHSPKIEMIEVAGRGDVRRAKLYYLRDRVGRKARVRERTDLAPQEAVERDLLNEPEPVAEPETDEGLDAIADGAEAEAVGAPEEAVDGASGPDVEDGTEAEGDPAPESESSDEPEPEPADAPEAVAEAESESTDAPEAEATSQDADGADPEADSTKA